METLIEDVNNPYDVHPRLWRWNPKVDGPNFTRFLDASGLPDAAKEKLRHFTPRVLGQSSPPGESGFSTGLVIGKVQSGKTNSFLALSALASDNGYRLIILLSGTKNILKGQTYRQVVNKLSRGDRRWRVFDFEPGTNDVDFETTLRTALSVFSPRTLVVTILKRTRADASATEGIDRLAELLERSELRDQLRRQPVLIVDDEADEASLDNSANARRAGRRARQTPTFEAILRLKGLFDRHVFIQYTATPQANLLAELTQQLSPDYCELLPPGEGYCGAEDFFPPQGTYWVEIPLTDVNAVGLRSDEPPDSLVDAIRFFYVGCALEEKTSSGSPRTRSMLVHPERQMPSHRLAQVWVQRVRSRLFTSVAAALAEPDSYLAQEFYDEITEALRTLSTTVSTEAVTPRDLMPFLHERLQDTNVRLINSQNQLAEDVDWDDTHCWIFVGGDVLQRGFAFQGLTTTWMARAPGTGQIDVLMQRGRFFGYRRDYLPYCRIWLPRAMHDDYYALFAAHEAALWRSVKAHIERGRPMTEWSRVFWIDPGLSLCRRTSQWFRMRPVAEWLAQGTLPAADQGDEAATNAKLVRDLRASVRTWRSGWTPQNGEVARTHRFAYLPLKQLADFIADYRFFGPDEVDHAVVQDVIASLLEQDPFVRGLVVDMRPGHRPKRAVRNRVVSQVFQGRGKEQDPRADAYYPGDREFRAGGDGLPGVSDGLLTIQLHEPDLQEGGKSLTGADGYLRQGCPILAAWLPAGLRSYRREAR
ncbi:Z1 domain-containing protein [Dactylosporangium sp. NPDC048998]|uniref:Z1 domain-containing protein n=1 Tax=Dactylosporangium sp. NPDC048998 TaxID=3363976 RepID=UPI0037117F5F